MSNITQYTKGNQIFYSYKTQKFCAYTSDASGASGASGMSGASGSSGSSGASGISGMSGASGCSGTSGASGASGASGYYIDETHNVTVEQLSSYQLASLINSGEIKISEVEKWCKSKKVPYEITENGNLNCLSFKYNKKQYSLSCNKELDTTGSDSAKTDYKETEIAGIYEKDGQKYIYNQEQGIFIKINTSKVIEKTSQEEVQETPTEEVQETSIEEGCNLGRSAVRGIYLNPDTEAVEAYVEEIKKEEIYGTVDASIFLPENVRKILSENEDLKIFAFRSDIIEYYENNEKLPKFFVIDKNNKISGSIIVKEYNRYYKDSQDKITWDMLIDINEYVFARHVVKGDDYSSEHYTDYDRLLDHLFSEQIRAKDLSNIKFVNETSLEVLEEFFANCSNIKDSNCVKEALMNALKKSEHTTDLQKLLDAYESVNKGIAYDILEKELKREDRIKNRSNDYNCNPDGELYNEGTEQGGVGDCWYLSGLMSASLQNQFQNYLKELTTIDEENKTYSMTLHGETYTFTFDDIGYAAELSNGDPDVRFQEMVMRIYLAKLGREQNIRGGDLALFTETMLGPNYVYDKNKMEFYDTNPYPYDDLITEREATQVQIDDMAELLSHGNYLIQVGINKGSQVYGIDENGFVIELVDQHAYDVINIDEDYVYVRNPHKVDGDKEYVKIDRTYFEKDSPEYSETAVCMQACNFDQFLNLFRVSNMWENLKTLPNLYNNTEDNGYNIWNLDDENMEFFTFALKDCLSDYPDLKTFYDEFQTGYMSYDTMSGLSEDALLTLQDIIKCKTYMTDIKDYSFNGHFVLGGATMLESYAEQLVKNHMYETVEEARDKISEKLSLDDGGGVLYSSEILMEEISKMIDDDLLGVKGREMEVQVLLDSYKYAKEQSQKLKAQGRYKEAEYYKQQADDYVIEADKIEKALQRYYVVEQISKDLHEKLNAIVIDSGNDVLDIIPDYTNIQDYIYSMYDVDEAMGYNSYQIHLRMADRWANLDRLKSELNSEEGVEYGRALELLDNIQNDENVKSYYWLNNECGLNASVVDYDICNSDDARYNKYVKKIKTSYVNYLQTALENANNKLHDYNPYYCSTDISRYFTYDFYCENPANAKFRLEQVLKYQTNINISNPNIYQEFERLKEMYGNKAEIENEIYCVESEVDDAKMRYYENLMLYGAQSKEAQEALSKYQSLSELYYSDSSSLAQNTRLYQNQDGSTWIQV